MKILLCAATQMEIDATVQQLVSTKSAVEILITGVGLMAATYAITKAAAAHRYDFIIQAGIGGTFDETKTLGDVVAVESETVADAGVEENQNFRSLFDLRLLNKDEYPWTNGKLLNATEVLSACGLPVVNGVTVNEISTNGKRTAHYRGAYNATIESMEGAALHYVGLMERIPFLQLRSLSNFVGERDKTKWMMQQAIVNLNSELQRILQLLNT